MSKITVAVVGLGSIARKAHLPVLAVHPGVDVVGLASRTGARVDELASQYRFHLQARTFDEILALKPQAAYLLSATEAHPEQAIALLEAGIAMYMEKPLANDLEGARRIVAAAEGRLAMVGFNRRFAPAYRRAKELFGGRTLEHIQITKHRSGGHEQWGLRQIVMDDAIHIIDLARFFGGDLTLQAATCRVGLTAAHLTSADGSVHLSQTYGAGGATERVELHGGGLTVIVEEMETLRIRENGVERVESLFSSWTTTLEKKGMAGATEHFLGCVRAWGAGAGPTAGSAPGGPGVAAAPAAAAPGASTAQSAAPAPATPLAEALRTQELAEAILLGGAR